MILTGPQRPKLFGAPDEHPWFRGTPAPPPSPTSRALRPWLAPLAAVAVGLAVLALVILAPKRDWSNRPDWPTPSGSSEPAASSMDIAASPTLPPVREADLRPYAPTVASPEPKRAAVPPKRRPSTPPQPPSQTVTADEPAPSRPKIAWKPDVRPPASPARTRKPDALGYRPRAIREAERIDWKDLQARRLPGAVAEALRTRDPAQLLAALDSTTLSPTDWQLHLTRGRLRAARARCSEAFGDVAAAVMAPQADLQKARDLVRPLCGPAKIP